MFCKKSRSVDNISGKYGSKTIDRYFTPKLQKDINNNCETKFKNVSEEINYYPNCDTSVWMRSCEKEVVEPIFGKTTGEIPKWLKGTLLRNGPGNLKVGNYEFDHLFDSSALLHR